MKEDNVFVFTVGRRRSESPHIMLSSRSTITLIISQGLQEFYCLLYRSGRSVCMGVCVCLNDWCIRKQGALNHMYVQQFVVLCGLARNKSGGGG